MLPSQGRETATSVYKLKDRSIFGHFLPCQVLGVEAWAIVHGVIKLLELNKECKKHSYVAGRTKPINVRMLQTSSWYE